MIILGSTGSIGRAALEIAKRFNKQVESLVAGDNITLLNEQIKAFKPKFICIAKKQNAKFLEPLDAKVFYGDEGIIQTITESKSNFVLNALVGFRGLLPSIITQKCNKTLALANKESLVAGGWLLDRTKIIPIDSEHFGLWYLKNDRQIKRLVITASGGAFRDTEIKDIFNQTKLNALKHPNWQMGQKITIDSATMVNKLFEVLEAFWLFGFSEIEAFIERTSRIHALIEFVDGSTTAHFALPDMRLPIAYAIDSSLASKEKIIDSLSLKQLQNISFEEIDCARYALWELKSLLLENPKLGVVLNAANEVAVEKFLDDEIVFGQISEIVLKAMESFKNLPSLDTYEEILGLDKSVRQFAQNL